MRGWNIKHSFIYLLHKVLSKIVQSILLTEKKDSILDYIFCRLNENMSKSYSGTLLNYIADNFTPLHMLRYIQIR